MNTQALKRNIFIAFMFLVPCFSSLGQECKGLLLDYIDRMSGIGLPDNKKVYYLHFYTKYVPWDSKKNRLPDVDAKIYLAKDLYFYESNLLSIYSDPQDFICTYPGQKKIYWSKGNSAKNKEKMEAVLAKAQKEIVSKGSLLWCKDSIINNKMYAVMSIAVPYAFEVNHKITKVTYYYSKSERQLKKSIIYYSRQHDIKSQTIEYEETDFNYRNLKTQRARDIVFDSKGQPRSKYKMYSIIDNRK
ncbi:MAG TPA: hypothetical protein VIH57_24490 [Bacteroidales bacterium]